MHACSSCGKEIERRFRFCPWCAEPQRTKLVEFFRAHRAIETERRKMLRVSRYLEDPDVGPHVRFSVWDESGTVEAAVSLDEEEAARLGRFVEPSCPDEETTKLSRLRTG